MASVVNSTCARAITQFKRALIVLSCITSRAGHAYGAAQFRTRDGSPGESSKHCGESIQPAGRN